MTSKLIPSNPSEVMVIRALSPNLTTLSLPFSRFGKIKVGGRATLVRLTSGSLLIFSPVALTPEVKATIIDLGGNLKYIFAPDLEHHIFLGEWAAAYPDAKVLGPEGLREKRARQGNEDVRFDFVFTASSVTHLATSMKDSGIGPDFLDTFSVTYIPAHPHNEIVLLYKPERTLIQADLFFHPPATEQYSRAGESATSGFFTVLFVWLWGDGRWSAPAFLQRFFLRKAFAEEDPKGFEEGVRQVGG